MAPALRPEEDYPRVQRPGDEVGELLHLFILRLHKPWMTADFLNKRGLIVHHRNHKKSDARLENLEVIPRAAHARHHNRSRQVFTPRKNESLFGFFAPQRPGPITIFTKIERDKLSAEMEEAGAVPPLRRRDSEAKKRREEDREAEIRLAALLPALRQEDDEHEEGANIPPPSSRHHQGDRLLGIHPFRRGCTPGEAAFVRVFIGFSALKTMAESLGLDEPVLRRVFNRPTVRMAIDNWRQFGRLPPPNSFKKLRVYLAREGLGHLAGAAPRR